jgi:hypothetical protein
VLRNFLEPAPLRERGMDQPQARYVRSYLLLRTAVGVVGIALPIALMLIDGLWFNGNPCPRTSLSAYYYSGVRELFVGGLSSIGVFLLTYKVAEINLDNTLSTFAGAGVLVVALFPTTRPHHRIDLTPLQDHVGEQVVGGLHIGAAFVFLGSLGLMSFFFGKREGAPSSPRGRRSPTFWRNYHWACAGVIAVALAWCVATKLGHFGPSRALLFGEVAAVWAFGASWLWKGLDIDALRPTS